MGAQDIEFLKRLQATFRVEANEHLRAISAGLIQLEKASEAVQRAETIETVFREAHSLKGAARSVNLKEIESVCQPLEGAFAALKRQEIALTPALFDLFHQAEDALTQLVSATQAERTAAERARLRELIRQLAEVSQAAALLETPAAGWPVSGPPERAPAEETRPGKPEERLEPVAETRPWEVSPARPTLPDDVAVSPVTAEKQLSVAETVRIPIARLDSLLLQAEEMIQAKQAAGQRAAELREIHQQMVSWKQEWAMRKGQHTLQQSEFMGWNEARLNALADRIASVSQAFGQDQRSLRRMVDDHLETMKQVLMLPVSTLVESFPRFVRDLARDQGKEVRLVVRGAEIQVDKRILEEIKDPLIHLVRNCIDHGIEKQEIRARNGKTGGGAIVLTFSALDSRQVEILVSDDGAGIDIEQVRAAAIKAGLVSVEVAEKLNPQETLAFIFQSGISTSEIITDISGRGLGLAIVREKVEKLGGVASVDTQAGHGTTFRLLLPLTLATFRGVLVRVDEQVFVLPIINVERAVRVSQEQIKTVETRDTIQLDGQILSLVRLADVLGLSVRNNGQPQRDDWRNQPAQVNTPVYAPVLVLVSVEKRIAVQVDEVLGEEDVLVKRLGKQLVRVRNIAGATILGTGAVVPVLNVSDLMKSAMRPVAAARAPAVGETALARTGRILVAEDSITARTLLKNILETAGYQVTTAVDGADAFTKLRSGDFELAVSDVDMPRMSGFELTTKIRGDKKLGELPVVLVTALESRQDRERGIEVGANAYIIKSSFDQSNLLEVVGRLL